MRIMYANNKVLSIATMVPMIWGRSDYFDLVTEAAKKVFSDMATKRGVEKSQVWFTSRFFLVNMRI